MKQVKQFMKMTGKKGGLTLCIENPNESTMKTRVTNKVSLARSWMSGQYAKSKQRNKQKRGYFFILSASKWKQVENSKAILLVIESKNKIDVDIDLMSDEQALYTANYKIFLREVTRMNGERCDVHGLENTYRLCLNSL